MPFKSYQQQRAMYAKGGKSAKAAHRFAHEYGTFDSKGKKHGPGGKKAHYLSSRARKKVKRRYRAKRA